MIVDIDQNPYFTPHARRRILEMKLTADEVNEALLRPEVAWQGSRYGMVRQMRRAGRVAVVVTIRPGFHDAVVTVLWNTYDTYERQSMFTP